MTGKKNEKTGKFLSVYEGKKSKIHKKSHFSKIKMKKKENLYYFSIGISKPVLDIVTNIKKQRNLSLTTEEVYEKIELQTAVTPEKKGRIFTC